MRSLTRFLTPLLVAATLLAPPAATASSAPTDVVPSPSRQPAFHRAQTSGAPVGRIVIPAIGVDEVVRSGVALSVIDLGVAHWSGTALPGEEGNVVLAGHRTTHTAPFNRIDDLARGDLILVSRPDGIDVMYRVTESFVVEPSELWITYDVPGESLITLFACHPKGSARYRLVVRGELVGGGIIA